MAKAKTQERELECLCMIVEAHTPYSTSQNIKTRPREYVFILHRAFSVNKGKYKTKINKTWSSVSNSRLSKTFALCQFRKLKVQKLCFNLQTLVWV